MRHERLIKLAELSYTRPDWREESQIYKRNIEIHSTSAYRFSLHLSTGEEYDDEFVSVNFHLREYRGVWINYRGDWTVWVRRPVRTGPGSDWGVNHGGGSVLHFS
jgi:hypothetical protein